jgi:hypothetical protein
MRCHTPRRRRRCIGIGQIWFIFGSAGHIARVHASSLDTYYPTSHCNIFLFYFFFFSSHLLKSQLSQRSRGNRGALVPPSPPESLADGHLPTLLEAPDLQVEPPPDLPASRVLALSSTRTSLPGVHRQWRPPSLAKIVSLATLSPRSALQAARGPRFEGSTVAPSQDLDLWRHCPDLRLAGTNSDAVLPDG